MPEDEVRDPLAELAAAEAADKQEIPEEPAEEPAAEAEVEASEEEQPAWQKYGFKTPEAMWDSYQNANQKIREQGDELGQLRKAQSDAQFQGQQQAQAADPAPAYYSPEQLERWVEEGQITIGQMAQQLATQQSLGVYEMMQAEMNELRQQVQPTIEEVDQLASKNALDVLLSTVGEDLVKKHKDRLAERLQSDDLRFVSRETRLVAMKDVIQSAEYEELMANRGEPATGRERDPVSVTGGSSAAPQTRPARQLTEEERELQNLKSWTRPVDEEGIPLPL